MERGGGQYEVDVSKSIDRMASPSPNVSYTVCSPIDTVALMPHNDVQYLHDTAGPVSEADRADRDQMGPASAARKPSQVVHGGMGRAGINIVKPDKCTLSIVDCP
jgi:hypothetical protein